MEAREEVRSINVDNIRDEDDFKLVHCIGTTDNEINLTD